MLLFLDTVLLFIRGHCLDGREFSVYPGDGKPRETQQTLLVVKLTELL
jgi:hypothetical protein